MLVFLVDGVRFCCSVGATSFTLKVWELPTIWIHLLLVFLIFSEETQSLLTYALVTKPQIGFPDH